MIRDGRFFWVGWWRRSYGPGCYAACSISFNPLLSRYVNWWWFIASQFAFGIVAGLVVVRQQRIPVKQIIPFSVRAGIETPGVMAQRKREDGQR